QPELPPAHLWKVQGRNASVQPFRLTCAVAPGIVGGPSRTFSFSADDFLLQPRHRARYACYRCGLTPRVSPAIARAMEAHCTCPPKSALTGPRMPYGACSRIRNDGPNGARSAASAP